MRKLLLAGTVLLIPTSAQALPEWASQGVVAPGRQFAAASDATSVHIIAERYVQVDGLGSVLADEADVGDGRQAVLDMYPAITVGPDGTVHVVTRHGGSYEAGHEIRYASRPVAGGWSAPVIVGQPIARNYVVGVATPSGGRILISHGRLIENVGAVIDLYETDGATATLLGTTPLWLRPDGDYRIAASGNAVVLASGSPGPGPADPVHFAFAGDGGADVLAQWQASHAVLLGGDARRGGPNLYVDETGRIHLGYGGAGTHHYARYEANGTAAVNAQTMDALGTYHLGYGNGAIVSSPDGTRVVAVALQNTDGDGESADAEILYAESVDGGATFAPAQSTGFFTDGGDGRMRPRLFELGGTLMLLYRDNALGGIALATSPWFDEAPEGTGTGGESGADGTATSQAGDDGTATSAADSSTMTGAVDPTMSSSSGAAGASATDSRGALPPGGNRGSAEGCGCTSGRGSDAKWLALLALLWLRPRSHPRGRGQRGSRTDSSACATK